MLSYLVVVISAYVSSFIYDKSDVIAASIACVVQADEVSAGYPLTECAMIDGA